MAEDNKKYTLSNLSLFEDVSAEIVAKIENECEWRNLEKDEIIFDDKNATIDVFFIVKGKARVFIDSKNQIQDEEKEVALAELKEGDYFGEISAIDGRPRTAKIKTTEPTILAVLKREQFLYLVERIPQISFKIINKFVGIIRALDKRVTELSVLTESERICSEIARLSITDVTKPNSRIIPIMPRHQDIAMWAGVSKEMVAKIIGELARNSIIERRSLSLIINDWDKLQSLCHSTV
ncbi:MAG: Crp/Fnr family transcriptional regulator [Alphaproteobacteria bacterium]